jgi:hypothetical protein
VCGAQRSRAEPVRPVSAHARRSYPRIAGGSAPETPGFSFIILDHCGKAFRMNNLTSYQQKMLATWQQHTYAEFVLKDADAALATITEHPYVFIVPSGIG